MNQAKQYKVVQQGIMTYMLIEFYKSPTMGDCHTGYKTVTALSGEIALALAPAMFGK